MKIKDMKVGEIITAEMTPQERVKYWTEQLKEAVEEAKFIQTNRIPKCKENIKKAQEAK